MGKANQERVDMDQTEVIELKKASTSYAQPLWKNVTSCSLEAQLHVFTQKRGPFTPQSLMWPEPPG